MYILNRKAGAGDAIGKGRWSDIRSYEKSAHLLVCSPAAKAFFTEFRQTFQSRLLSRCILIGCIHPMCNRGRDIDDYYHLKPCISSVKSALTISVNKDYRSKESMQGKIA
jgi:hypothetical protein